MLTYLLTSSILDFLLSQKWSLLREKMVHIFDVEALEFQLRQVLNGAIDEFSSTMDETMMGTAATDAAMDHNGSSGNVEEAAVASGSGALESSDGGSGYKAFRPEPIGSYEEKTEEESEEEEEEQQQFDVATPFKQDNEGYGEMEVLDFGGPSSDAWPETPGTLVPDFSFMDQRRSELGLG